MGLTLRAFFSAFVSPLVGGGVSLGCSNKDVSCATPE